MLRWNFLWFNLWPFLFILSLGTTEKSLAQSYNTPQRYFYGLMRSPLSLLQTEQAQLPRSLLVREAESE